MGTEILAKSLTGSAKKVVARRVWVLTFVESLQYKLYNCSENRALELCRVRASYLYRRSAPWLSAMRLHRLAPVFVASLGLLLLLLQTQRWQSLLGCAQYYASQPQPIIRPPPPSKVQQQALARPGRCARNGGARQRARYELEAAALPRGLPGGPADPLHLTFATASVDELLANWVAHVRQLHLPALVSAMDRQVLERCALRRVHCLASFDPDMEVALREEARKQGQRDPSAINFRGNPMLFISLGARKVDAILTLLATSGRAVIVSDVDVVWLHDPRLLVSGRMAGFEDFAHADVLASTDCLDPSQDRLDHGCFNTLQDRNTGVIVVRNTSAGRAAMVEWRARTAGAFAAWETDQTAFDDLLRGRGRGHRRNMTNPQRRDWLAFKKRWCGYPAGAIEAQTMGTISSLDGRRNPSSRALFDVCIPQVSRALRFGLLPLACTHTAWTRTHPPSTACGAAGVPHTLRSAPTRARAVPTPPLSCAGVCGVCVGRHCQRSLLLCAAVAAAEWCVAVRGACDVPIRRPDRLRLRQARAHARMGHVAHRRSTTKRRESREHCERCERRGP